MTAAQTFTIGKGYVFVSGLFWQPLPRDDYASQKREVLKIAKEQSFDLMVIRSTGSPQVGFASTNDGLQAGISSAAAMVSKTIEVEGLGRNALCAVEIEAGRWFYFAQRDGVILYDGDFIGTEEEVKARMEAEIGQSDWQAIIAPKNWEIPQSIQRTFDDFIPKRGMQFDFKKWWLLRPVVRSWSDFKNHFLVAGAIVAAIICIYGYTRWSKYKAEQEIANFLAEEARRAQLAEARKVVKKPDNPWKKLPLAIPFAEECNRVFKTIPTLFPANWTMDSATCTNDGTLVLRWNRQQSGREDHLLELVPTARVAVDGSSATLILPLNVTAGENEDLLAERPRILAMKAAAEKYQIKLNFTDLVQPAELQSDQKWKPMGWNIAKSSLPPAVILATLDGKGFRVNNIRMTYGDGLFNWYMDGVQYVYP